MIGKGVIRAFNVDNWTGFQFRSGLYICPNNVQRGGQAEFFITTSASRIWVDAHENGY